MKKICIVTGSRAEYGLLRPLMQKIKEDKSFILQIIATGMHLSEDFGCTYKDIIKDGFEIDYRVDIDLTEDTPAGISKSMGLAMIGFGKAYEQLKPELVVVLGDRFEIFSAVSSAHVARIPVAHLHGGEVTEGAFDDAFRHSITKMSYLHFVSTEEHKKRVIQLGESPERVFNVGAIGLDNVKHMDLLSKDELEKRLQFRFNKHNLLVTYHPVTLENDTSQEQFQNILNAMDNLENTNIIFTKTNADTNGRIVNTMIDEYVEKNRKKAIAFTSMGQLRYLSTMQFVDAVVGNSSSGIIEAPSFRIGTINVGDRQKGRTKASSTIDCGTGKKDILDALTKLYSSTFQAGLNELINPYGDGNTAVRIVKNLKNFNNDMSIKKKFYDINGEKL